MRTKWLISVVALAMLPGLTSSASTSYVYDNLGRIWTVTYDNGLQVTYSYDAAGNRTSVVTQTGTNRPPQANNYYVAVVTNTQTPAFFPLSNDVDPDGDALTISSLGATAQGGTTTLNHATGAVKYTPPANFQGLDTFTYAISDGHAHTASATVYASISNGIPPIAVDDSAKTPLNTAIAGLDVLANDSEPDPPGHDLTISSVTSPTANGGTVAITGLQKLLTYTPAHGVEGQDTFSYTITDGFQQYATAQVSVFVGAPPVANDDYQPVALNTATTWNPLVNDTDPYGFPLTVSATGATANGGTVAINGGLSLTYTPPSSTYTGPDSFTYTISNGHGLGATATEHMCVGNVLPIAPTQDLEIVAQLVIGHGNYVVPSGVLDPRVGAHSATDPCGSPLDVTAVTPGAKGHTYINLTGDITYTYNTHVLGFLTDTDAFTYTVTSQFGASATGNASVNIDVEGTGN